MLVSSTIQMYKFGQKIKKSFNPVFKQQTEHSLTVDNDNVCKVRKHVCGSEMRQPFGLFSMTFHDLGLIPRLPRPEKFEFQIP